MWRVKLKVYEYIKSLPKDDMALFLTYFCSNPYGSITNWKINLLHCIGEIHTEFIDGKYKPILTYEFLEKEFEGKSVYSWIREMKIQEMSGMFGRLKTSISARFEILTNGNPIHIIGKQVTQRIDKNMLRWLECEI